MDDNLVPIVAIFLIFGLPVIGWITMRVLAHRERMAMLQRGLVPPPDSRAWRRMQRGSAEWAPPPWAASVPPQPAAPPPPYAYGYDPDAQCTLQKGIRTSMVGLALLIGLSFIGYHSGEGPFGSPSIHPGPWLLGGLIPLFVGVAQVIIGLMGGAQFARRPGMIPPPSAPPPPNAGQRTYGQPAEPGRPGPRFEELARPVPPPDRL